MARPAKERMRLYRARRRLRAAIARYYELGLELGDVVQVAVQIRRGGELASWQRNPGPSYTATHAPDRVVLRRRGHRSTHEKED
jgi:hypothetical protein